MERSRKILLEISSVSQNVVTAASKYADWKGLRCVSRAHFQLEEDMCRLSVACDALADSLAKSLPTDSPKFDVRLRDWLCAEEPQICLNTLTAMIKLLQTDTAFWTMFNPWRGQPTQDRIKEAVELLHSYKDCFHFLFSTTSLDNESATQNISQSQPQINAGRADTQLQTSPPAIESTIDTNILDPPLQTEASREIRADKQRGRGSERTLDDILKWLDGLNCTEKQDRTLLRRQPDTCEWLFDTAQYKTWWNNETSCLWLRGKPGAGKSVLASSVIESLEKIQRKGGILAFFYCDFRNERSTNASEVLRSLLSQLLRQLPGSVSDLGSLLDDLVYAKDRGGATRDNVKELAGFTSRAAGLFAQRPLVVVDALDECKNVEDLLKGLIALRGHGRLFVTSRPLQVIKCGLSGFSSISMDDMVEELSADIALHITRELATCRRLRDLDVGTKTEIHTTLCHKADGMFRWVECSIDTLNRCATMKEVHQALVNLPEGLDETYERILRAIDLMSREGQLALRALVWLVAALRPLKIQELVEGLSIDLANRVMDFSIGPMHTVALLDACGSLVTYSEKMEIISLSHFSVKEYLISEVTCAQLPKYHINWELAHLQLVRSCMCYISICLNRLREARSSGDTLVGTFCSSNDYNKRLGYMIPMLQPLRDYVIDDALGHFQHLGSQFSLVFHDIEALADVIEQHWYMWDNICLSTEMDPELTTLNWPLSEHDFTIYVIVAFAPDSVLRSYLHCSALNYKKGTNPLIYAAYFNREAHARTLLSRGADLSCKGWGLGSSYRVTVLPIEVAVSRGHITMVALFLAEESPVPTSIFRQYVDDEEAYLIPGSICTMLLNTDDFVEAVNDANDPILDVKQLDCLRWGDLPKRDLIAAIPRLIQVGTGSLNIGKHRFRPGLLLGFAVEDCVSEEDNALAIARFLAEYHASEFSEETISVILRRWHPTVIEYLLSLGLSLPPDALRAVLYFHTAGDSFYERRMSTIRLLIENGVDVHACTLNRGDSVLHVVLSSPYADDEPVLDMTKRLIGYGCSPCKANLFGETPLDIALSRGRLIVAHYLHWLGVPLPARWISVALKPAGEPPLWNRNPVSIVHFLIENGADVKTPLTGTEGPILHSALASPLYIKDTDMLEITKLLINVGCSPFEVNSSGQSALHIAIKFGYPSVIQYLLSLGIPLPLDSLLILSAGELGVSLRHYRKSDLVPLFSCLIENGANIHARTAKGDSPLHLVLQKFIDHRDEALDIATLLVTSGCSPLEVDSFGKTPIHIAVEQGHLSIAEYLHSLGIPLPCDSLRLAHKSLRWMEDSKVVQMVRFLISNGADINACTLDGDSLYHTSFRAGFSPSRALNMAKLLVHSGCSPLKVNCRGESPLHIAIQGGLNSVVRYFLSLGTPLPPDSLLVASRFNGSEDQLELSALTRILVDNGADVHARTEEGHNALHVTLLTNSEWYYGDSESESELLEIAKILVAGGCDPFQDPASTTFVFKTAVKCARVPIASYLVTLGVPLPPDVLIIALTTEKCYGKSLDAMVHFLIDNGADVKACAASGDSTLHLALQSNLKFFEESVVLKIAKSLVYGGCDPLQLDSRGRSAIQIAMTCCHTSVVQYLLSLGIPLPSSPPLNVLFDMKKSYRAPSASLFRFLVENGYDVYRCASDGESLFHVVLRSFDEGDALEFTKLLIGRNYDPFQVNASGDISLYIALKYHRIAAARYLWSIDPCNVDLGDSSNKSKLDFPTAKARLHRRWTWPSHGSEGCDNSDWHTDRWTSDKAGKLTEFPSPDFMLPSVRTG